MGLKKGYVQRYVDGAKGAMLGAAPSAVRCLQRAGVTYRPTCQIIHPFANSPSNAATYAFADPPRTPIDTHLTCLSNAMWMYLYVGGAKCTRVSGRG